MTRFIKSKKDGHFYTRTDRNLIRDMLSLIGLYQCINEGVIKENNWESAFDKNKDKYKLYNKGKKIIKALIIDENGYETVSKKKLVSNSVFNKLCETHMFRCVFLPKNADLIFGYILDYIHSDDNVSLRKMYYQKILLNCPQYSLEVNTNGEDCLNWILKFQGQFISFIIQPGYIYSTNIKSKAQTMRENMRRKIEEVDMYRLCHDNRK